MVLRRLSVLGMVALFASSCATRALWNATDPLEHVSVSQREVSEAELQARGVRYGKDDERGLYYVEKTKLQRLGDYSVRFFATPVTVVLDTATVIVIGGAVVGAVAVVGSAERHEREVRESESMGRLWP